MLLKVTSQGFISCQTWISLQQYCISLDINIDTEANKIQCCLQEIQIGPGRNPGEVTLRQHAHREAGSCQIFFLHHLAG